MITQIASNTTPIWAAFVLEEGKFYYQPVNLLGLTAEGAVIPIVGDMNGEFFNPRDKETFLCLIYDETELNNENLTKICEKVAKTEQKSGK